MVKPPKIELTFGKNDQDLYNWIESQGVSKATLVKRILRDAMNGVPTNQARNVPTLEPMSIDSDELKEQLKQQNNEPTNVKKNDFGFADKMGGGMDF